MSSSSHLHGKLVSLEVHLAHVQRLYEQLNEVVTEQAMKSDRTERRLVELERQLKQVKEKSEPDSDPLDEKPPHY